MSNTATWLSVGDLELGFEKDPNILPAENTLVGKSFTLFSDKNYKASCSFISDTELAWRVEHDAGDIKEEKEQYRASSLRENIFFIDFVSSNTFGNSISLVLDLENNIFTLVVGILPQKESTNQTLASRISGNKDLTLVEAEFIQGTIDKPFVQSSATLHEASHDLIGKRIQYQYSPTEIYEHIYLNKNMYSWHCIEGVEAGLADTDRCHYYKIANRLYLFVWREKIIPTLGVVMIDLDRLKTTGKIMGYKDETFQALSNFPVGAFATPLNTTKYQYASVEGKEGEDEK